jgi:hypothetical protein
MAPVAELMARPIGVTENEPPVNAPEPVKVTGWLPTAELQKLPVLYDMFAEGGWVTLKICDTATDALHPDEGTSI